MPLVLDSLTLGPDQEKKLQSAFSAPPIYRMAIGPIAWKGTWPAGLRTATTRYNSNSYEVGLFSLYHFNDDWPHQGIPPLHDRLAGRLSFRGNINPGEIDVEHPLWIFDLPDGRAFWGTCEAQGAFSFPKPSFRMHGEIAITRFPDTAADNEVSATFSVMDATIPDGHEGSVIW